MGLNVTKENVIAVYLEVRKKSMTKANIISAFRKTGIRPLDPTVFKEEEYAPSWTTSTQTHLPDTYPCPTSPDGRSDVSVPPLHVATAVPGKENRRGRSISGQSGPYVARTALLATLRMLEEQLATARAEAEAATAYAVLMARENLKVNNLLNAKAGKKKEGGSAMSDIRRRTGTEAERGRRKNKRRRLKQNGCRERRRTGTEAERGRRKNKRRRLKQNGCRERRISRGGDKKRSNMPKKCKSDEHYAISLGWSTRTLRRSDSRREDVGVGAAKVEEEEEEIQGAADRVHIKKRTHPSILIPRTLPTPQKAAPRRPLATSLWRIL
ncbi:hypothetical protein K438DRAFT_1779932 [Mycena galopus ATCC 62051]|nr:hypothetical protein K438DRAFT_1779932 [Mycena galopus ATCC 62051]